jgi:hypothetical protein
MAIYRLKAIARSPSHNAVFKAGKAFDRIEAFFVSGEDPPGTAFRPPLEGTLQPGVRAPMLHRLDYLPSFCGIPMFSAAFVQAMGDVLRNEVELHPCTSCAKTDRTTGTSRGCCEGYACSNRSHRAPAMAPCDRSAITCTDLHENVFLACEKSDRSCHVFVAGDAFKAEVDQHGLRMGVEPALVARR